jgi:hypothetical protein
MQKGINTTTLVEELKKTIKTYNDTATESLTTGDSVQVIYHSTVSAALSEVVLAIVRAGDKENK